MLPLAARAFGSRALLWGCAAGSAYCLTGVEGNVHNGAPANASWGLRRLQVFAEGQRVIGLISNIK
jgi:hypothetical protein